MRQTTRAKMTDELLLEIINLRSLANNPYDICKKLKLTPTEFKDIIHSREYKNFVNEWMGYVSEGSKLARKRTLEVVNKYERTALRVLFELAESAEKTHEKISAAKAALAHCQAVTSAETSREYQEAISRLESLVKVEQQNG